MVECAIQESAPLREDGLGQHAFWAAPTGCGRDYLVAAERPGFVDRLLVLCAFLGANS